MKETKATATEIITKCRDYMKRRHKEYMEGDTRYDDLDTHTNTAIIELSLNDERFTVRFIGRHSPLLILGQAAVGNTCQIFERKDGCWIIGSGWRKKDWDYPNYIEEEDS